MLAKFHKNKYGGGWHEQFAWQALLQGSTCLDFFWHGNGLSKKWLQIHAQGYPLTKEEIHQISEESIEIFKGEDYYPVSDQKHPYPGGGSLWARRNNRPCFPRPVQDHRNLSDIHHAATRTWVGWDWPLSSNLLESSYSQEQHCLVSNNGAVLGAFVQSLGGSTILRALSSKSPNSGIRRRLMDEHSTKQNNNTASEMMTPEVRFRYNQRRLDTTKSKLKSSVLSRCGGPDVTIEQIPAAALLKTKLSRFLELGSGDALFIPDASSIAWSSRATLAVLLEVAPRLQPGTILALGNVHIGVPDSWAGGGQFIAQALGANNALFRILWPTKSTAMESSASRFPELIVLQRVASSN